MVDNDQLLDKIEKLIEPIKSDIADLKQSQAQTSTVLEAVAAGQKELQATVATKADIQDLRADLGKKVKDHEERIEELEEEAGIPHPHKH